MEDEFVEDEFVEDEFVEDEFVGFWSAAKLTEFSST